MRFIAWLKSFFSSPEKIGNHNWDNQERDLPRAEIRIRNGNNAITLSQYTARVIATTQVQKTWDTSKLSRVLHEGTLEINTIIAANQAITTLLEQNNERTDTDKRVNNELKERMRIRIESHHRDMNHATEFLKLSRTTLLNIIDIHSLVTSRSLKTRGEEQSKLRTDAQYLQAIKTELQDIIKTLQKQCTKYQQRTAWLITAMEKL